MHFKRAIELVGLCYCSVFDAVWTLGCFVLVPIITVVTNVQVFHEISLASAAAHKPFPIIWIVASGGLSLVILAVASVFGLYGLRQLRLLRSEWREVLSAR